MFRSRCAWKDFKSSAVTGSWNICIANWFMSKQILCMDGPNLSYLACSSKPCRNFDRWHFDRDAWCVKPTIIGQIWTKTKVINHNINFIERAIAGATDWMSSNLVCYVREKLIEWEENGKERISPESSHIDLSRYIWVELVSSTREKIAFPDHCSKKGRTQPKDCSSNII